MMTDKMQITKVAFVGEGEALKIKLKYRDLSETGGHEEYEFGCDDAPKDSFIKAMKAMADHVRFFCDFKDGYAENDMRVVEVNIGWVKGKMKASLKCVKVLYGSVEFEIKTPVYAEVLQADDDPTVTLPADVMKSIKTLLGQAKKYIKGERSQISMALSTESSKPRKPINGTQQVAPFEDDKPHSSENQVRHASGRFGSKKESVK